MQFLTRLLLVSALVCVASAGYAGWSSPSYAYPSRVVYSSPSYASGWGSYGGWPSSYGGWRSGNGGWRSNYGGWRGGWNGGYASGWW